MERTRLFSLATRTLLHAPFRNASELYHPEQRSPNAPSAVRVRGFVGGQASSIRYEFRLFSGIPVAAEADRQLRGKTPRSGGWQAKVIKATHVYIRV